MRVDRIRSASADDIGVLAHGRVRMFQDMAASAGEELDDVTADRLREESVQAFRHGWGNEHVGWVAETAGGGAGGIVVAGAMVSLQPWLPHPRYPSGRRPYLHSMFVDPDHRGRGLAGRLTETAMSWARELGHSHLVLHASDAGRPVYERLGFVDGGELILALT